MGAEGEGGPVPTDERVLRAIELDDSFEVVRVLGEGSGGRTELVVRAGEPPCVRKRIPRALANARAWEAAKAARSEHLPAIRLSYWLPDAYVVVYDYVEGETAERLVGSAGPLAEARAATIGCDVCEAAVALHAVGVIHRDITPGNVIVSDTGATLVDLGIAREHTDGARRDTTRLGTWGFAAPEQFGFAQTDARSDVYSIGCLLGYLLTGCDPQDARFERGLAARTCAGPAMAAVVSRATAFEPSRRYDSARGLADAIRDAVAADGRADEAHGAGCCGRHDGGMSGADGEGRPHGSQAAPAPAAGTSVGTHPAGTTPAALGHALADAHGALRAQVVLLLVLGGAILAFFVLAARDAPADSAAQRPFVVILTVMVGLVAADLTSWQPSCVLLHVGSYASGPRWRVYLRRLLLDLCVLLVAFVVLVLLLAALLG